MISDKETLGKVEINSEDLLKEMFPFKKPLTSRYRKKYVEVLALSVLQYCYGDIYAGFDAVSYTHLFVNTPYGVAFNSKQYTLSLLPLTGRPLRTPRRG